MAHISISVKITGDAITALGQALKISKAIGETIHVEIYEGKSLAVQQESNVIDLYKIFELEHKIKELSLN